MDASSNEKLLEMVQLLSFW